MPEAFRKEATVEASGETLTLTVNFAAIDAIESLTGEHMDAILPQLADPGTSLASKVLWGLLREHHHGITLDEVLGIVMGPDSGKVGVEMGALLARAFNVGKSKDANPPPPPGA